MKRVLFLMLVSTVAIADDCGNNIVVIDKKSQNEFVSFALRFNDQHTAEEFADQVNSAPIVKDKRAKITIKQKATVYTK